VTAVSLGCLAAAAAFAMGDWIAKLRQLRWLEYVCKPATLAALVAVATTITPVHDAGARRDWFVAALALSLLGDVLLMLPADAFVAGLGAFLAGHVLYVAGFWSHGPAGALFAVVLVAVLAVLSPVATRILTALRGEREMAVPVALYMAVIAVMASSALSSGSLLAALGAVLFVVSDTMIAWNRFVRPFAAAEVGIMVTYHLGQAGLVLSLAH
jgi:uncharacterized membrane protein YhhN